MTPNIEQAAIKLREELFILLPETPLFLHIITRHFAAYAKDLEDENKRLRAALDISQKMRDDYVRLEDENKKLREALQELFDMQGRSPKGWSEAYEKPNKPSPKGDDL